MYATTTQYHVDSCWHHVHIFHGRSEAHWESNLRLAIWRKPTHWNLPGACALWRQPLGRKKQVDIDGLKSTVSSRKKEAFGSTLQSLQLCFDSGPMAVSSIIGHVGGIHVEVHFENLRCQCIEYVVQKTEPYWAIARVQSCFSACTYEWLAQDLL